MQDKRAGGLRRIGVGKNSFEKVILKQRPEGRTSIWGNRVQGDGKAHAKALRSSCPWGVQGTVPHKQSHCSCEQREDAQVANLGGIMN